jgi:ribosomal-protein-alanine N-acetyltransferase
VSQAQRFEVEGPRLFIRPWRPEDCSVFIEKFAQDADMMRHINDGRPWEETKIEAYFDRQRRFLVACGCCVGAVVSKADGKVIGGAGIQPQDLSGDFEFAWSIWKEHWGMGLATEAALALKDHAFRVMQKIGMRHDGVMNAHTLAERYPDVDMVRYVLDNPVAEV